MAERTPTIDPRTSAQIAAEVQRLAEQNAGWHLRTDGDPDAGSALIAIFARMAGQLIDRINSVPEKQLLAFLDLIGVSLLPPQPARAPLTFYLATGARTQVVVPEGSQVGAPARPGLPEAIFETVSDLVLTPARLTSVFVRQPDSGTYADRTATATGADNQTFAAFEGQAPIPHRLYLACAELLDPPGTRDVIVTLNASDPDNLGGWRLDWEVWSQGQWQPVDAVMKAAGRWRLRNLPESDPTIVNGRTMRWLRGSLNEALPVDELTDNAENGHMQIMRQPRPLDAIWRDNALIDAAGSFSPFGQRDGALSPCFIAANEQFGRVGARITLSFELEQVGAGSDDLNVSWSYYNGDAWVLLGNSRQTSGAGSSTNFHDTSLGLTKSGRVTFTVPPAWQQHTGGGLQRRLLLLQVTTGNYGIGENFQPPRVRRLRIASSWDVPPLERLTLRTVVDRAPDLAPDQVQLNNQPLAFDKDLYPFGEYPRFNDALMIASAAAFGQAGATVRIAFTLRNPVDDDDSPVPKVTPSLKLVLAWEIYDGARWHELGRSSRDASRVGTSLAELTDTTRALTVSGEVQFTLPSNLTPGQHANGSGPWLRARIVSGDYGSGADIAAPIISELALGYELKRSAALDVCLSENDFHFADHTAAANGSGELFHPFVPTRDRDPSLYLGFDRPLANAPMTLYLQVQPQHYDPDQEALADLVPPQLVWEYADAGRGWHALGALDETNNLRERGLLRFIGPGNSGAHSEFGRSGYWLRVRWAGGDFRRMPELRRVLTNTTWALQASSVRDEILGSSDGSPKQSFQTRYAPLLLGQRIIVHERERPAPAAIATLESLDGPDAVETRRDSSGWVIGYAVRWSPVPDFYASGPDDRHYVIDHLTGSIRFGDGRAGKIPPLGRNNIVAAHYRYGGGSLGNRGSGEINELKAPIAYVDSVTNLEPAPGGIDQEQIDQARERGPRQIRHRGRAVTGIDFADLAYEASPDLALVKAVVPHFDALGPGWIDGTDLSNVDLSAHQSVQAGAVGLVVVPRSNAERPDPSLELLDRVEAYVRARCSPLIDLWLAGPDWLAVHVEAELVPRSIAGSTNLATQALAAVQRFLHPLSGGFEGRGWEFGRRPARSDLFRLFESLPDVAYVYSLEFSLHANRLERAERSLIYSGQHLIRLRGPEER
jgi:hypothetical protein